MLSLFLSAHPFCLCMAMSCDSLHRSRCWYRWCWGCSGDGV